MVWQYWCVHENFHTNSHVLWVLLQKDQVVVCTIFFDIERNTLFECRWPRTTSHHAKKYSRKRKGRLFGQEKKAIWGKNKILNFLEKNDTVWPFEICAKMSPLNLVNTQTEKQMVVSYVKCQDQQFFVQYFIFDFRIKLRDNRKNKVS